MRRGLGAGGGGRWSHGRCLGALPKPNAPREAQARDSGREQRAELAPHGCGVFCAAAAAFSAAVACGAVVKCSAAVRRVAARRAAMQSMWAGLAAVQFQAAGGEEYVVVGAVSMQGCDEALTAVLRRKLSH